MNFSKIPWLFIFYVFILTLKSDLENLKNHLFAFLILKISNALVANTILLTENAVPPSSPAQSNLNVPQIGQQQPNPKKEKQRPETWNKLEQQIFFNALRQVRRYSLHSEIL